MHGICDGGTGMSGSKIKRIVASVLAFMLIFSMIASIVAMALY